MHLKQNHIVVDISANGYGHLAQLAPILQTLYQLRSNIAVTVRTDLDRSICAEFINIPFEMGPRPPDPDMRMRGPLHVDENGLFADYSKIFSDRDAVIAHEAQVLRALSADLMITNISMASVASAKAAGIPAAAVSSLNWADVFEAYCGDRDGADDILDWMIQGYSQADLFLLLTPHLPTSWLPNPTSIGPIARIGNDRRKALEDLKPARYYVMASMGGIPGIHSEISLPPIDGVVWITPPNWRIDQVNSISRDELDISFIDLMKSADAIVTKAGYGSVTEAAANGTRILYTDRLNWCETPILEAWMTAHCTARKLPREALHSAELAHSLETLLAGPNPVPVEMTGASEAATAIATLL